MHYFPSRSSSVPLQPFLGLIPLSWNPGFQSVTERTGRRNYGSTTSCGKMMFSKTSHCRKIPLPARPLIGKRRKLFPGTNHKMRRQLFF